MTESGPGTPRGPGRPQSVDARDVELVAMELFAAQGYGAVTVSDIAERCGVSRRTFHRYFPSKADVLWVNFDREIERLEDLFGEVDPTLSLIDAVRTVVVRANRYTDDDMPELRLRMELIGSSAELQAVAAVRYDAWERAVARFVAMRLGVEPDDFQPLLVSRVTLAACRTAYDLWAAGHRSGNDEAGSLLALLDEAIRALGPGFDRLEGR